jgi:hypothetical protein
VREEQKLFFSLKYKATKMIDGKNREKELGIMN